MTRLHPAAPFARTLRVLIGIGAAVVLAVVASGCANGAPPAPTPDPFAGLADRSDQAFRQGLEAYGQGQYRDALTSFEQARLLSPAPDPRVDQMIERAQVALAPAPTAVPAPTEVPVVPTATSVPMTTQAPDTDLGSRYFGNVSLAVVPAKDTDSPAATQFFFQDQIGLHIEGLKQHLRLPFTVRVFDLDTSRLIAEVQSDNVASVVPTAVAQPANIDITAAQAGTNRLVSATPSVGIADASIPGAATAPTDFHLVRFWDTFVWYHQGGERPGRYRLELFANGILTNTFDYVISSVPLPTPTTVPQVEPTLEPTPSAATVAETPPAAAAAPAAQSGTGLVAPAAAVVARAAPTSIPVPTPTIVPTPAKAFTSVVGGVVAGLDVDSNSGRFYMADTTGVIWSSDAPAGQEQSTLSTPFFIGARSPVDLAVDQSTGYLYLSTRICAPAAPGCVLVVDSHSGAVVKSISLPGQPSDLRVDSGLGLLYVGMPDHQALVEIDMRSGTVMRTIDGLPQITSLALDPVRHMLYMSHLAGQVTVLDARSGQVTARVSVTGAGLSSVAAARGLAYAVNTATHEIAVLEPASQAVTRYLLSEEPAAVTASETSGAVYVLSSRSNVILAIDPTSGFEIGRVLLSSRAGQPALRSNSAQSLRPRMVLNVADQTVFASLPEVGSLAAVTVDELPALANLIPFTDIADQGSADAIPGVLQPAADALPSQPGPSQTVLAQTADEPPVTPADTAEEGL